MWWLKIDIVSFYLDPFMLSVLKRQTNKQPHPKLNPKSQRVKGDMDLYQRVFRIRTAASITDQSASGQW